MMIAVLADSHDNEPNIRKVLNFLRTENVDAMIHCGDICTAETLELFAKEFQNPIHIAYGNIDYDTESLDKIITRYPHLHGYGETGELQLDDVSLAFTHFPQEAKKLASSGKYQWVFYGHSHKPWEEKVGACRLLNPGTLAGMWYKATFALVDLQTGKATLKLVERLEK